MELNKKYEIGPNKYIEPISIVLDKGTGHFIYLCRVYRRESFTINEYHSLHIQILIDRWKAK